MTSLRRFQGSKTVTVLGLLAAACLWLVGCRSNATSTAAVASSPLAAGTSMPTDVPTATRTSTPTPTGTPSPTPTHTATPTSTPIPGSAFVAFETYRDGNGEIYLLDTRTKKVTNLTRHPAEDRSPAWRPDGRALAFESNRDGNWEIYLLSLADGSLTRLTQDLAYDGAPSWSPDGTQIAIESYRDGNLEIYVIATDQGNPVRLTTDPAGDYGPAWSPDGHLIAFTSWRDGNKEIYLVPASGGEAQNLTQNPADDEDASWAPDGTALAFTSWRDVDVRTGTRNAEIYQIALAGGAPERLTENPWPDLDPAWDSQNRLVWATYDPGPPFETYDPYRPGDYHLYYSGAEGPERLTDSDWDDRRPAPAPFQVAVLDRLPEYLPPEPTPAPPTPGPAPGTRAQVVEVPSMLVNGYDQPIQVNEWVAPSLMAWQQEVLEASGWDLLHLTLGTWRNIDQVRRRKLYTYDYGYLSWHKTGRALDMALEYKVDGVDQMVISREDLGEQVFWRMYLRPARQDGSQGEPLKDNPWRFWWQIVAAEEPEAYDAGGKRLPIPSGYYADITALAKRHGWERIASYAIEGDYHWHTDSNGTEYWHYERTDDLTWWGAMLQIYPAETLERNVGWEAGLGKAQSEAMMRSKGIPTPTP